MQTSALASKGHQHAYAGGSVIRNTEGGDDMIA